MLVRSRHGAVQAKSRAVCHLKSLVVTAATPLRHQLHPLDTNALIVRCARLRTTAQQGIEHRGTVMALETEANDLESQIELWVREMAPELLDEPGVGPLTAAEILIAWSHSGRLRSETAFAMLAGVAPIPASSGQVVRYRLNRHGDRALNCALHTIVLNRSTYHEETRQYVTRRVTEGKSDREIRRCLKRYLARRLFKLLESREMAA